jgi:uncharacterized membrane protein YeaQ/YmgE (transglycosylase-associated protein family)
VAPAPARLWAVSWEALPDLLVAVVVGAVASVLADRVATWRASAVVPRGDPIGVVTVPLAGCVGLLVAVHLHDQPLAGALSAECALLALSLDTKLRNVRVANRIARNAGLAAPPAGTRPRYGATVALLLLIVPLSALSGVLEATGGRSGRMVTVLAVCTGLFVAEVLHTLVEGMFDA